MEPTHEQPSPSGSAPQPRSEADSQQLLLLWTDLLEQAAAEGDPRLVAFYLGSGQSQGLSPDELLRRALQRRPGDPLLERSLARLQQT